MKNILFAVFLLCGFNGFTQKLLNPVIKNYGGIYNVEKATVKVDPEEEYKIVVDVVTGAEDAYDVAWGLTNVARMINLHAVSGADIDRMHVVLAIHGSAAYTVMSNKAFRERFDTDNPNIELMRALKSAGVKLTVCGQSLIGREIDVKTVLPEVEITTSMLTTVTTYQLKGYAMLKF